MNSIIEFLNMGGYAFYVWMSYGIALLVLIADFIWPRMARRKILAALKYTQTRREKLAHRTQEKKP